jgi:hypothetical protein
MGFFLYLYEMKAKELIYNLRSNLAEAGSQLMSAPDQHLMYMLDEARAKLAAQKMDSRVNVVQMSQAVDVKPINAPKDEIGQIGSTKVLKLVIPEPISYLNGGGIFTVGSTDGEESYTEISYSQLRTALSRKYTASSPKWFWYENALYVINAEISGLQKVRVRGIFDEPYKVEIAMGRYKYLQPFSWEYPLTLKDADTVYKLAMSGDMGWGDDAIGAINKAKSKAKGNEQLLGALQNLGKTTE